MVNLGSKMLKKNKIYHFKIDEIYEKVLKTDRNYNFVGCNWAFRFPNLIFKNFLKSKAKYLFFLFHDVFISFIRTLFSEYFSKVLGGVHNNLYSEKSLNYIFKKYNLKILGEWWFGTDIMDLMRIMIINTNDKNSNSIRNFLNNTFYQL